jgi:hypothetical protein
MGAGRIERVAVQHHLGAEAARAFDLHAGREARHHDQRAQAQPLRVIGHTLRMVAGRHGDHAACTVLGKIDQLVARTPFLERGCELQVLEFQEHLGADDFRQRARLDAGRIEHLTLQARRGALDFFDSDHGAHCGWNRTDQGFYPFGVFPKPKVCVMVSPRISSLEVA